MKNIISKAALAAKNKDSVLMRTVTFAVCFMLTFLRYCYFGIKYYPQLDDYIQYGLRENSVDSWDYIKTMGLLKSRPLAGVFDELVWSKLFSHMVISLLIITVLYVLSAMLFEAVFKRRFGTSTLFVLIYTLLPLGFEGVYWLSASSRVVPSLFFSALGIYLLDRYYAIKETAGAENDRCRLKGVLLPAGYIFFGLFAVSYYEQGLVLFAVLGGLVFLSELFRTKKARSFASLLFFVPCISYFLFTHFQPDSSFYSGRMVVTLPWHDGWWNNMLISGLKYVRRLFIDFNFKSLAKGFLRGAGIIVRSPSFIWCAVTVLLLVVLFFIVRVPEKEAVKKKLAVPEWLIYSSALIIMPISVFFVIGTHPYICCRNAVTSFVGIALLLDGLVLLCVRSKKLPVRILSVAFALAACVASVSEIADYKRVYDDDTKIVDTLDSIPQSNAKILGIEPVYLEDSNYVWNDHVRGCIHAKWALSGCATLKRGTETDFYPIGIITSQYYNMWSAELNRIRRGDNVYLYDYYTDTLIPLTVVFDTAEDGGELLWLYRPDGSLYGTAVQYELEGWLRAAE